MIAEQYGLTYKRVTIEDIELIRYWRNQPHIKQTMQFQEDITPEMQLKWFQSINNKDNYYFIIEVDTKKIGMINCKNADPITRIAEGGIFIWDLEYWNTPIPVFAALSMLEGVFEVFSAAGASIATVKKDNTKALHFNKMLGYEIIQETKNDEFIKLLLTKERYFEKTKKLKKAASIYSRNKMDLKIIFTESDDLLSDEIIAYRKQINS
jgi:RimJ/RimL family protein N-acetyltransferase